MRFINRLIIAWNMSDQWDLLFVAFLSIIFVSAIVYSHMAMNPPPTKIQNVIRMDRSGKVVPAVIDLKRIPLEEG